MSESKWTETRRRIIPESSYPRILYTWNEDIALPPAPSPPMAVNIFEDVATAETIAAPEQMVSIFEDIITPAESPVVSEQADAVPPVYLPALSRSFQIIEREILSPTPSVIANPSYSPSPVADSEDDDASSREINNPTELMSIIRFAQRNERYLNFLLTMINLSDEFPSP